jgi:hypothetical protein
MSDQPTELFYERARRIEGELKRERCLTAQMIRMVGEKDTEIARLREALQSIVVEADTAPACPQTLQSFRSFALSALEKAQK